MSVSGYYIKCIELTRTFLLGNMFYIDNNKILNNDNDKGKNIFVENEHQSELPSFK